MLASPIVVTAGLAGFLLLAQAPPGNPPSIGTAPGVPGPVTDRPETRPPTNPPSIDVPPPPPPRPVGNPPSTEAPALGSLGNPAGARPGTAPESAFPPLRDRDAAEPPLRPQPPHNPPARDGTAVAPASRGGR